LHPVLWRSKLQLAGNRNSKEQVMYILVRKAGSSYPMSEAVGPFISFDAAEGYAICYGMVASHDAVKLLSPWG